MNSSFSNNDIYPRFDRKFLESGEVITSIGDGSLGGKASGLALIKKTLQEKISSNEFPDVIINIPRMVVIRTDVFDAFMSRNNLYEIAYSDEPDEHIAMAFINASLPTEILGDLRSLVENIHVPLAVRSSSMLEDAKHEPFAGIYATKMIPNNHPDPDQKFIVLREAIKFVYASTFFKAAKDYFKVSSHSIQDEKMAVIIQEVVGQQYYDRFYPNFSGVARSFNYYPAGRSKPEHGVVNLALGLGKTIVDGGLVWSYSPLSPKSGPPFGDPYDMMKNTQTTFWAVNMNPVSEYTPAKETEYMNHLSLTEADYDSTMKNIASTYDVSSQRIVLGIGVDGPRVLNFAPLLGMNEFRFNDLVKKLLKVCEEALSSPIEIEFAVSVLKNEGKIRFGFLQVRPMVVPDESIELEEKELFGGDVLLASDRAMGNGIVENILDVVFVMPETFDKKNTLKIAEEVDAINRKLVSENTKYVLIGFGRWGSSDPWLGIPVEWSQIAGAKVIVESTLFGINVELSQGSHFFHNLTSFKVNYFSITFDGQFKIDWKWLDNQKVISETEFVKHVKLEKPLQIKVDGRKSRGVIKKW
ncbi:MAG: PEP/pyruvate-binding domain-containing protein [Bacteroidota bacterium]